MDGRKKYIFGYFLLESDKNPQEMYQKRIDPLYIGPDKSFYNFKNWLDWVYLDLISKSSSLTLDSSCRLIVQNTLHTLYTTQNKKSSLKNV